MRAHQVFLQQLPCKIIKHAMNSLFSPVFTGKVTARWLLKEHVCRVAVMRGDVASESGDKQSCSAEREKIRH